MMWSIDEFDGVPKCAELKGCSKNMKRGGTDTVGCKEDVHD
jgi:hypothetical protein